MIQDAFADYYSDAYISQETDPNALYNLADRLDLAGYYTDEDLQLISEAYLTGAGGEEIGRYLAPVVNRWNHALSTATDKDETDEVLAFRADARAYRHAWDFLSQIVDYKDPLLHRRAILAGLLVRNLHTDALIESIDTSNVELTGVALVARAIDEDHSIVAPTSVKLLAADYDGTRRGSGESPEQIALWEAVEEVNQLFSAHGLDLNDGSGEAWTRATWGILSEDPEVQAMSKENSDAQLKASPKFKDKVTGALVAVATDSATMTESAMSNPEIYDALVELLAKVTAAVHGNQTA